MQQLKVLSQQQGMLSINYEEIKQEFEIALKKYKNLVVTEDNIQLAKKDKANLNNVIKDIDAKRISLKKFILEPYVLIEQQLKELSGMVEECSEDIKKQLEIFDRKEKKEKLEQIEQSFNKLCLIPDLKLEQIFNEKWYNKGYTINKIEQEILEKVDKVIADLRALQQLNAENYELLRICYLKDLDINKAIELNYDIGLVIKPNKQENCLDSQKSVVFNENTGNAIVSFVVKGKKDNILKLGTILRELELEILSIGKEEL